MVVSCDLQILVAEGQYTQLDSIFNNRSISLPVLVDPYETGFEMYLTRGWREWVVDETGLLATVQPAAEFDLPLAEKWRLSLVNDFNPGPDSSSPSWLLVMGSYLYFTAYRPDVGVELWRTNGTGPGMELVKDVYPGQESSSPTSLTLLDSTHFLFSATGVSTNWMIRNDTVRRGGVLLALIVCGQVVPPVVLLLVTRPVRVVMREMRQCNGFRRSTVDIRVPFGDQFAHGGAFVDPALEMLEDGDVAVFYAVSESPTWVPGSVYDCPSGYHWASTVEGQTYFTGQREGTGGYLPFPIDGTRWSQSVPVAASATALVGKWVSALRELLSWLPSVL